MEKLPHHHRYGEAESILKFNSKQEVEFFDEPLKKIFEHPDVKNRQIVAFSTIGAFRKGKSFFLDYCLRFLYANYASINYPNNPLDNKYFWMGSPDQPLFGFSWRGGSTRDTSGILIWNDAFLYTVPRTGEKIAIVVMDTQGLFDNETTVVNNSRIFALSSLLSSIQVLNLSSVVQEDQLQYLQFATEFAKFASKENQNSGSAFQNLMFLIRDWSNPDEFKYGVEGGEEYMNKFLNTTNKQNEEIKIVRYYVRSAFENLSCALMPHPGLIVTGSKGNDYDGNWGKMHSEFKEELKNVIEHLLSPERLVVKKINGEIVKGSELFEIYKDYFDQFKSNDLPKVQSVLDATIERQMTFVINECFDTYKQQIFEHEGLIDKPEQVEIVHNHDKKFAMSIFKEARKMGTPKHEKKFKKILENQIEEFFKQWSNKTKENLEKIRVRNYADKKKKYAHNFLLLIDFSIQK